MFWRSVLALILLSAAEVHAQSPKRIEGVVVQVSDQEIIIDLGSAQGLPPRPVLKLFRRIVVKHPITNKEIQDRFPIGAVEPDEVGENLTIVRNAQKLTRMPKAGDFVVYEPPVVARASDSAPRSVTSAALSADAAAIERIHAANLGNPIPPRIGRWEGFLKQFSQSPYVPAVAREVALLRSLQMGDGVADKKITEPSRLTSSFLQPRALVVGEPATMAIAIDQPQFVSLVRLVIRKRGEPVFETIELAPSRDYYYSADLPARFLAKRATLEYLIEAVRTNGKVESMYGLPRRLVSVAVLDKRSYTEVRSGRTRATVTAENVDFYAAGDGRDRYIQAEAGVRYGLDFPLLRPFLLRAFRVGVGTIDGEGGKLKALDAGGPSRKISLAYGFAEGELDAANWFGIAVRSIIGNHHATVGGLSRSIGGMELRARVGQWDGTRLVTGVALIEDLGRQAFTEMHIEAFPKIPIVAGVAVTNFPVAEDLGVRLTTQAGYRVTDWLALNALAGWNARTINHYGYSLGGGVSADW